MIDIVICGYARSAFTPAKKGKLAKVRPDDLAAEVVDGLIKKTGINTNDVEDLILGCAFPEAEQGMNLARNVVFLSELPNTVGGVTVNRFCASSMQAIHQAAGAINSGSGDLFIAGGVESMSRVPMPGFNPMLNPNLIDIDAYIGMGHTAENLAKKYSISRKKQENMALESHQKASKAQNDGKLKDEIIKIGYPESMSKSKKNTIDPEKIIENYGADAVRLFILSDSPPEKDVQWSETGMLSSYKFTQKLWTLHQKFKDKIKENSDKEDKEISIFTNQMIQKIKYNLEKFHYNVIIANLYESYNFFNNKLNASINKKTLLENYIKFLSIISPIIPHFTSECLADLKLNPFQKWPEVDKNLIKND